MKNKVKHTIATTILFITAVLITASIYIYSNYGDHIDEIIYYLFNDMKGTSDSIFINGIIVNLLPFSIIFLIVLLPVLPIRKLNRTVNIKLTKNKKFQFSIFPNNFFYKFRIIYATCVFVFSTVFCFFFLGINDYIKRITNYSPFIETHYVDGKNIEITFPEKKRNLIILYLESTENTFMDKENGGGWEYNVTPELTQIAKENINFSNSDKIGGAYNMAGATWTIAALVSTTAGIPLKIPIDDNSYTTSENFLSGAYALGDILRKEGYNLELMVGSDADFGGRTNYFTKHGNYEIFDLYTAIEEGKMTEDDKVWWGFDDTHLFSWAKEEILELASQDQPFSFSFLTVNTHFPDGWLEEGAIELYDTQYENVFAYSSKQVAEFVDWFKKQDFYEDTTLVITGDHLSMQEKSYYDHFLDEDYERTIYNAFINAVPEPVNTKNRIFTNFDMFPTILASIGVKIEGDRIGLGTNLFSERKTLAEEVGLDFMQAELEKNSNYYNRYILQDDYLDLIQQNKQEE